MIALLHRMAAYGVCAVKIRIRGTMQMLTLLKMTYHLTLISLSFFIKLFFKTKW